MFPLSLSFWIFLFLAFEAKKKCPLKPPPHSVYFCVFFTVDMLDEIDTRFYFILFFYIYFELLSVQAYP